MTEREKALKRVQMYSFAGIEAQLFLDTHPQDKQALEYFKRCAKALAKATEDYNEKYGPLTPSALSADASKWEWVKGPWPWEVAE